MNKKEFKELDREQMIIAFNQLKDDYSSLFDELEQEKERNTELRIQISARETVVDKLKEKIEEVYARTGKDCNALHDFQREAKIDVLKELLGEI